MSLPQKLYTDYRNLGDSGDDTPASIQPIQPSEPVGSVATRRPSENLRSRTEIVREYQDDLLYYRDRARYVLDLTSPGVLSWGGTAALGGTGRVNNSTQLVLRPMLAPSTTEQAQLTVGTAASNQVIYTPTMYVTDGANQFTVEHRNVASTPSVVCTISEGPIFRVLVVFDAANSAHDASAVASAVSTVVSGRPDVVLTVTTSATPGVAAAVCAETAMDTKVHVAGTGGQAGLDAEAHVLAGGALNTFTTGRPLVEGDVLAIRYDYVIEPAGGDPDNPKGGVPGGRAESVVARGNANVVPNLFVIQDYPQWAPGAIPLCKIVQNVAVWLDGTNLAAGTTGAPGSSLGTFINGGAFSGNPTLIVNGGIDTAVATIQGALVSVDTRLSQHRYATYVVTDGVSSTGGTFNASGGLDSALTALGGSAGVIKLRRGSYTLSVAIPAGTVIEGEGSGLVTVTLTANTTAGARSKVSEITIASSAFSLQTNGHIEQVVSTGGITLLAGGTCANSTVTNLTVQGNGTAVRDHQGANISVLSTTGFTASNVILSASAGNGVNLGISSSSALTFTNLQVAGSAAQNTSALISTTNTCTGIHFQNLRVTRTDASTGAVFNISSGTSLLSVSVGALTLTRGAQFLTTTSTNLIAFDQVAFSAPATNTDVTATSRFVAPNLTLTDCTVEQLYNAVRTFTCTNLTLRRTPITAAWGNGADTHMISMATGGTLTCAGMAFVNGNPLQGGYRPIYGADVGGGIPMILSLGNTTFDDVDFSTDAEVTNNGVSGNPEWSTGLFLVVSRTVGTDPGPVVYMRNSGFFTRSPRHVQFTGNNACFFSIVDTQAIAAGTGGPSSLTVSNFRTAAQPVSSVQSGTETILRVFNVRATQCRFEDTTDLTTLGVSGAYTYAVVPQRYIRVAGNMGSLSMARVQLPCGTDGSTISFLENVTGTVNTITIDGCTFTASSSANLPLELTTASTPNTTVSNTTFHYTNASFLGRFVVTGAYANTRVGFANCTFRSTGYTGASAGSLVQLSGSATGVAQFSHCLFSETAQRTSGSGQMVSKTNETVMGTGNVAISGGGSTALLGTSLCPAAAGSGYFDGVAYYSQA